MDVTNEPCLSYWGLNAAPFENNTDPAMFFESRGHSEAVARLYMCIERRKALTLVTGDYGTGKSMVWSTLRTKLNTSAYIAGSVFNPLMSAVDLIKEISFSLGCPISGTSKYDVLHAFNDFLERSHVAGKHCVAAIDEAHLIPDAQTFEEIRLLLNFQPDHMPLITIVFIGQTELRDRLRAVPQLAQRIEFQWHIHQLDADEVKPYITHRLGIVGSTKNIFNDESITAINKASRGTPREINRICSMALLTGAFMEKAEIDVSIIQNVLKEIY